MKSRGVAWRLTAVILIMASFVYLTDAQADEPEPAPEYAIVWCADVSDSMKEADVYRFWVDAVALGVDLSPLNTEAAFVAVNDQVVTQVDFSMMTGAEQRAVIKEAAENTAYSGYTNFNNGLAAALDLLENSRAGSKHLFFIADICESGYSLPRGDYDFVADEMALLAQRMVDADVRVHLLFMGYSKDNFEFMPLWDVLVHRTGGDINYASPYGLTKAVEEVYFSRFAIGKTVIDMVDAVEVERVFPVFLPRFALERARFLIDIPVPGIQTDAGEVIIDLNRSYTLLELEQPFPEKVELSLPPGQYGGVPLYLLTESNMRLDVTTSSILDENESATGGRNKQKTSVIMTVTTTDGAAGFPRNATSGAGWHIVVTDPAGERIDVDQVTNVNNRYSFDFYPEVFGVYRFAVTMDSHGVQITANAEADIYQIGSTPVRGFSLSVLVATLIGLLIIAAALVFNRLKQKPGGSESIEASPLEFTGVASQSQSQSQLYGRLDIYGILVDGGKTEIPPIYFHIKQLPERRRVKLSAVLEHSGIPYRYRAAEDIILSPGPDSAMVVRNNSQAVVYSGGRPYYKGQQTVIDFGQKIRVVFEEDINEYEIYYHNSIEMVKDRVQVDLTNS